MPKQEPGATHSWCLQCKQLHQLSAAASCRRQETRTRQRLISRKGELCTVSLAFYHLLITSLVNIMMSVMRSNVVCISCCKAAQLAYNAQANKATMTAGIANFSHVFCKTCIIISHYWYFLFAGIIIVTISIVL